MLWMEKVTEIFLLFVIEPERLNPKPLDGNLALGNSRFCVPGHRGTRKFGGAAIMVGV